MTQTEKLIAEARELDRKATPGPWVQSGGGYDVCAKNVPAASDPDSRLCVANCMEGSSREFHTAYQSACNDAAFIAHSRTLIPALCDMLEQAQSKNSRLIKEVSTLAHESIERDKVLAKLEAEVMAAIETQDAQQWIPVAERLPEDAYGCLLIVEDDDYFGNPREVLLPYFAGYDGEQWNDGDGQRVPFEVTHWQWLPVPPKGED